MSTCNQINMLIIIFPLLYPLSKLVAFVLFLLSHNLILARSLTASTLLPPNSNATVPHSLLPTSTSTSHLVFVFWDQVSLSRPGIPWNPLCVAVAGLGLGILPQPLICWDYSCIPPDFSLYTIKSPFLMLTTYMNSCFPNKIPKELSQILFYVTAWIFLVFRSRWIHNTVWTWFMIWTGMEIWVEPSPGEPLVPFRKVWGS